MLIVMQTTGLVAAAIFFASASLMPRGSLSFSVFSRSVSRFFWLAGDVTMTQQEGVAHLGGAHVDDLHLAGALFLEQPVVLDQLVPARDLAIGAHAEAEEGLWGRDLALGLAFELGLSIDRSLRLKRRVGLDRVQDVTRNRRLWPALGVEDHRAPARGEQHQERDRDELSGEESLHVLLRAEGAAMCAAAVRHDTRDGQRVSLGAGRKAYQNLGGAVIAPDRIAFLTASIEARPPGARAPHSNRVASGVQ